MKHILALLVLSVPLALAGGCGSGSSSDNHSPDGTSDGSGLDNDGSGGTDGPKAAMLTAAPKVGVTGDFYFEGDLICQGKSSCQASVAGVIEVEFKCPKHLFLPQTAYVNGKDVTIAWEKPGDWGLAPKGTYRDQNGFTYPVETKIDFENILFFAYGLQDVGLNVHGGELVHNGKQVGSISDDLKKIVILGPTPEDSFTLTLVE